MISQSAHKSHGVILWDNKAGRSKRSSCVDSLLSQTTNNLKQNGFALRYAQPLRAPPRRASASDALSAPCARNSVRMSYATCSVNAWVHHRYVQHQPLPVEKSLVKRCQESSRKYQPQLWQLLHLCSAQCCRHTGSSLPS